MQRVWVDYESEESYSGETGVVHIQPRLRPRSLDFPRSPVQGDQLLRGGGVADDQPMVCGVPHDQPLLSGRVPNDQPLLRGGGVADDQLLVCGGRVTDDQPLARGQSRPASFAQGGGDTDDQPLARGQSRPASFTQGGGDSNDQPSAEQTPPAEQEVS